MSVSHTGVFRFSLDNEGMVVPWKITVADPRESYSRHEKRLRNCVLWVQQFFTVLPSFASCAPHGYYEVMLPAGAEITAALFSFLRDNFVEKIYADSAGHLILCFSADKLA